MAYVSELCGKKHRAKMAATLNESVATGPSEFAKNQLKLMGWKEGEGLGKNRQGIATHIKVEKRKEAEGLGHERQLVQNATNQWWTASIGETLSKLQKPAETKQRINFHNKLKLAQSQHEIILHAAVNEFT